MIAAGVVVAVAAPQLSIAGARLTVVALVAVSVAALLRDHREPSIIPAG
jgi:hypothetical protein